METVFDPEKSAAIRAELIAHVAAHPARARRRPMLLIAMLGVGALVGAGASTAAFAASGALDPVVVAQPDLLDAVDAPPGTIPGGPVISTIGDPVVITVDSDTTHSLADRPAGTTHVRVTVSAVTAGSIGWGTDAGGNNPSATFSPSEAGESSSSSWYDFPLDDMTDEFFLTPRDGMTASVTFQYLNQTPTHLRYNEAGQSFGLDGGPDGSPDLIRVSGVGIDGESVEGYAFTRDVQAFSPEHPEQPSTPEEALQLQEEREQTYPHGWDIPIFESDGTTRIGTFHIG